MGRTREEATALDLHALAAAARAHRLARPSAPQINRRGTLLRRPHDEELRAVENPRARIPCAKPGRPHLCGKGQEVQVFHGVRPIQPLRPQGCKD